MEHLYWSHETMVYIDMQLIKGSQMDMISTIIEN
jgi:hypothetical protein